MTTTQQPKILQEIIEAFESFKKRDILALKNSIQMINPENPDVDMKVNQIYDAVTPYAKLAYSLKPGEKLDLQKVSDVTGLTNDKDVFLLVAKVTLGYFSNPGCGLLEMKYEVDEGENKIEIPLSVIASCLKENIPITYNGVTYSEDEVMFVLYRNDKM